MNGMQRAAAFMAAVWMSVAGVAMAADAPAVFEVGTMRVERHGERGSPVILIPGLASGAWVWKDSIAALQGEHRLYVITLVAKLEVVTIAPARHFVMLDQPQAFNEALRKFLGALAER